MRIELLGMLSAVSCAAAPVLQLTGVAGAGEGVCLRVSEHSRLFTKDGSLL